MKSIFITLVLLTLTGCSAKNETLKFSIQDLEPWVFSGEKQGIAEKFIYNFNAQENNNNIQIRLSAVTLDSIKSSLEDGSTDLAVLHNGHRIPSNAVPMLKVTNVPLVALTLKDSKNNTAASLKSKKIAYWREEEDLLDFSSFGNKVPVDNHHEGIKLLESGEVSAFIAAMHPTSLALKKGGFDKSNFKQPFIIGRHEAWVYFSKNSPHIDVFETVKAKIELVMTQLEAKLMH